jgi:hypothetical protein
MPRHGCSFLNVERIGGLVDWIGACALITFFCSCCLVNQHISITLDFYMVISVETAQGALASPSEWREALISSHGRFYFSVTSWF